jgi:hypothetical protein
MTFETEDRQRRLTELARDIVFDEARWTDSWNDRNPTADTALAVAVAKARETYAADIASIKRSELNRAQNVVDMWGHNGWGIAPAWARAAVERLKHLEDDDDNVDDALAPVETGSRVTAPPGANQPHGAANYEETNLE